MKCLYRATSIDKKYISAYQDLGEGKMKEWILNG